MSLDQIISTKGAGFFERVVARLGHKPVAELSDRQVRMALDRYIRTGGSEAKYGVVAMDSRSAAAQLAADRMDASVTPLGKRMLNLAGLEKPSEVGAFADGDPIAPKSLRLLLQKLMGQDRQELDRFLSIAQK